MPKLKRNRRVRVNGYIRLTKNPAGKDVVEIQRIRKTVVKRRPRRRR